MLKILFLLTFATMSVCGLLFATFGPTGSNPVVEVLAVDTTAPKGSLQSFRSEKELKDYLQRFLRTNQPGGAGGGGKQADDEVSVESGVSFAQESITNVQHAGVDEGGIVKLHGDHVVVLRRGRLFTISIKGKELRPVSVLNAFGPDIDPNESWYDEMLISGNTIAVIGYSYERGGTEVGLFRINDGILKYDSTYQIRSNDYYSSRNYASRLIGNRLIFYSPTHLSLYGRQVEDLLMTFPSVRKWKKDSSKSGFRRVAPASRVYRGIPDGASYDYLSLHNVVSCEIESGEMDCKATSIIGPSADVFYVSPRSVYVWAADWWSESGKPSTVYKMPLDGGAPSALSASGSPVDQFSFLEGDDGYLNVVVRSGARGAAMWNSEKSEGATALVRIPVNSFGDGSSTVPTSSYRSLPVPKGYTFQNRFIGSHLLYGTGSGWGDLERIQEKAVFVTPLHGEKVVKLPLGHGVDRIEALGSEAVIVGGDEKDLHFTSLRLSDQSSIADRYVLKDATQGELRSHGFFYKPSTTESGILGLPVRQGGRPGYEHIYEGSASVIYLENRSLRFVDVGSLTAKVGKSQDDGCRASCVDWYGNARPLFIGGRVFALLGYEVVEGSIHEGQIKEMQRTYFGPASNTKN